MLVYDRCRRGPDGWFYFLRGTLLIPKLILRVVQYQVWSTRTRAVGKAGGGRAQAKVEPGVIPSETKNKKKRL